MLLLTTKYYIWTLRKLPPFFNILQKENKKFFQNHFLFSRENGKKKKKK